MIKILVWTLAVFIMVLIFTGCAMFTKVLDVEGEWMLKRPDEEQALRKLDEIPFTIRQTGTELTGTIELPEEVSVENPTIKGSINQNDEISFSFTIYEDLFVTDSRLTAELTYTFEGDVTGTKNLFKKVGNEITGTCYLVVRVDEEQIDDEEYAFIATREAL